MLQNSAGLLAIALLLGPFALIIRKAGYGASWVLLAFVPGVNLAAFIWFALADWPIEQELRQLRPMRKRPGDAAADASWELKQLGRRIATLEELADPAGPSAAVAQLLATSGSTATDYFHETVDLLQQHIDSTDSEDERAFVTALLQTAKSYEGRILGG